MGELSERESKKKKRRQWNSEHLPHAFLVRVTKQEHEEITKRAKLRRLSASRYLVACGLSKVMPKARDREPLTEQEREQVELLLRQLFKVGTNLNQLAHGYNLARYT